MNARRKAFKKRQKLPLIKNRLLAHNSCEEAILMKKPWLLLPLLILTAALLAGCASNADTLASPTPGATSMLPQILPEATNGLMTSPMPQSSALPESGAAPSANGDGIGTLEEARKASEAMEEAIEKLTEVEDAYVVATDKTAVVGVKFTSQYQGKVDDRLKKMVLSRAQTVNKAVTGVAVTDDDQLTEEIESLAETLKSSASLGGVASQAEELAKQITVYTE